MDSGFFWGKFVDATQCVIHRAYILIEIRCGLAVYNPQIEMFARFKMKSSFHKTKRII